MIFQRWHCASFISGQMQQTINLGKDKTAEFILYKTEDKQFWFDSCDDISLQKQTLCVWHVVSVIFIPALVDQKLITTFKQHMNTDFTASMPSVTLNF